jgi:RNA polymerase sigma-54 factor
MQLNQTQVHKLAQELRLTPQQILQSTILQLNTLALEARVMQEIEQNPVLEEITPETVSETELGSQSSETEPIQDEEREIDWEELLPQNDDYRIRGEYDPDQKQVQFEQPAASGLVEHLFEQLKILSLDELEHQIAEQIIWNLDDRGYLTTPIENIAYAFRVPEKKVLQVLQQIQQLDPPGIAARNLQECLLIQLEQLPHSEDAKVLVRDHFENFANRRFETIMRSLGWDKERLQKAQDLILKLNPKPGNAVGSSDASDIVPDLIVEKVGNDFVIEINDTRIPELRISNYYLEMINNDRIDTTTKNYLKKKIDSAKWFIQAIYQRRQTMIKVMKAIIARQRDFFEDTSRPLKPMILKDIAEDVQMDISTISRVTNGKYVQLPTGIYELKYFFSEGMVDEDGDAVSTRLIKARLQEIIDGEDKKQPFSDDQLSKLLKKAGFPVARRTVAKYREQLKIPIARLRRTI